MRKKQISRTPITIANSLVDIVSSYKYLGVKIQDNLKWNEHVDSQTKKANKRMYSIRRLKKLNIDSKLLCLFYNSVISSVLVYAISSWYEACDNKLKQSICTFHHKLCKLTNVSVYHTVENPEIIYEKNIYP